MTAPAFVAPPTPRLDFAVERVRPMLHAVSPSIAFALRVTAEDGQSIDSLALQIQLRIAAAGRRYSGPERERLAGLFGGREQWARALRSLHWASLSVVVPRFRATTLVELPVPITCDCEVANAQYFLSLEDGEIPVDLLFNGTVFFTDPAGLLQVAMIPWEKEARCMLPLPVWRAAMDAHFPGAAWIRVQRPLLDRLLAFRSGHAMPTWDHALAALLDRAEP